MGTHVDKITATVEDFEPRLNVQSFELDLAVNTIPTMQLNVLPIKKVDPGGGKYATASSPNIKDITTLYSELLELTLTQSATATIKISADTFGEDTDELNQLVTLEKWILTDVGLSTVTPSAAPVLTAVFSHPSVLLDKTGFVYERVSNPMNISSVFEDCDGEDMVSYIDDLYEKFSNGEDVTYYDIASHGDGGPKEEFKKKVQKFRTQLTEYAPGKYIEGNMEGKLFLEHVLSTIHDNVKEAIGPISAPIGFSGSTWKRLVTRVCPTIMAHIIPTYDREKLLMEPFSPWQECSYSINTPLVCGIDVASIDPSPIIGVASLKDDWEGDRVANDAIRNVPNADGSDFSFAFYFPKRVLEPEPNRVTGKVVEPKGVIVNLGRNEVITDILTADRNANSNKNANAAQGEDLQQSGNGIQEIERTKLEEAYVKAMFLMLYRQNCRASVTTIPLLKDSGAKTIYPGRVLTVYDTETKTKLFYGYVIRVIVRGASEGGGSTTIVMSHARPTLPKSTFVDEGTENPCYPPVEDRKLY